MLQIKNLTKNFDYICAVNNVSLTIEDGIMYGLLGTNGAGKSTLLRLIAGILQADEGEIWINDESCYDNPNCKSRFFYLPDTPYYFPNANMNEMTKFYAGQYPQMDVEGVQAMAEMLNLDVGQPLRTFSKGMKRQAFLIMALCANTKYLLCDEVFDGLDPIVTEVMKNLIREAMKERQFTVVVVSHKLRDLEDICGQIGILHKGGLVSSGALQDRTRQIHKLQCVFETDETWMEQEAILRKELDIVKCQREGCFVTLIVRDDKIEDGQTQEGKYSGECCQETIADTEKLMQKLKTYFPIFCKEVPMTLEEIFMMEMEGSGYDIRKVLY